MTNKEYVWTDNPTVSGVSKCDTDILNECLMHLKYENNNGDGMPLFYNFYSKEDMTTTGAYVNASLGSWLSGNIYPTAYDELVNKLGTGNVKASTDTYTDYDFVVNQGDMTFRLPIKNGQEIMFATGVRGDGTAIGLTDGTQFAGIIAHLPNSSASFFTPALGDNYGGDVGVSAKIGKHLSADIGVGITPDSTKSGIILDTENITIPDGWNLYYKVANVITNQELLDVAYVTADLNTKLSRENKQEIASWCTPDYSAGIIQAANQEYIVTIPGVIYASGSTQGSTILGEVLVNGQTVGRIIPGDSKGNSSSAYILVDTNDVYQFNSSTINNPVLIFYPLKGANQ